MADSTDTRTAGSARAFEVGRDVLGRVLARLRSETFAAMRGDGSRSAGVVFRLAFAVLGGVSLGVVAARQPARTGGIAAAVGIATAAGGAMLVLWALRRRRVLERREMQHALGPAAALNGLGAAYIAWFWGYSLMSTGILAVLFAFSLRTFGARPLAIVVGDGFIAAAAYALFGMLTLLPRRRLASTWLVGHPGEPGGALTFDAAFALASRGRHGERRDVAAWPSEEPLASQLQKAMAAEADGERSTLPPELWVLPPHALWHETAARARGAGVLIGLGAIVSLVASAAGCFDTLVGRPSPFLAAVGSTVAPADDHQNPASSPASDASARDADGPGQRQASSNGGVAAGGSGPSGGGAGSASDAGRRPAGEVPDGSARDAAATGHNGSGSADQQARGPAGSTARPPSATEQNGGARAGAQGDERHSNDAAAGSESRARSGGQQNTSGDDAHRPREGGGDPDRTPDRESGKAEQHAGSPTPEPPTESGRGAGPGDSESPPGLSSDARQSGERPGKRGEGAGNGAGAGPGGGPSSSSVGGDDRQARNTADGSGQSPHAGAGNGNASGGRSQPGGKPDGLAGAPGDGAAVPNGPNADPSGRSSGPGTGTQPGAGSAVVNVTPKSTGQPIVISLKSAGRGSGHVTAETSDASAAPVEPPRAPVASGGTSAHASGDGSQPVPSWIAELLSAGAGERP